MWALPRLYVHKNVSKMKAVICDECQTSYHLYCLASKSSPEEGAAKCYVCGQSVRLSVGGGGNAANGENGGGGGGGSRSGGEKRKRVAVVASDSDSE